KTPLSHVEASQGRTEAINPPLYPHKAGGPDGTKWNPGFWAITTRISLRYIRATLAVMLL
ncbi:MAG: hypothetical protein ACOYMG_25210, partial [Candidatus Methylumidiphilus sp.]